MPLSRTLFLGLMLFVAVACTPQSSISTTNPLTPPNTITARDLQIVTGQTIYVPAYSEIFYGSPNDTMPLSVTLAIHNTDFENAIYLKSVSYYDTNGVLVREYAPEPIEVSPLATTGFVINDTDLSGGWGANFIVVWGAETPVHEPIIEAVMVSTRGTHGLSMISEGRVLSQTADIPPVNDE